MAVVDGRIDIEKLAELLAEGGESESLDFKRTMDLNDKCAVVELAKDTGAMEMLGGYIVVGADDSGTITGELSAREAELLDESRVRGKLRRYLPEPLDIRTGIHNVDGDTVCLVYIGANPMGWRIFAADGACTKKNGKTETTFRKGEVYARHGSASEPWQQHDVGRALARLVDERKEGWRREFGADLASIVQTGRGPRLAEGPAAALTWQLDGQTFLDTVVEQLRRGDEIPIQLLLRRVVQDAARLMQEADGRDELGTLLDRMACLAALYVQLERHDLHDRVIVTLVSIYSLGFDGQGMMRHDAAVAPPQLWLDIVARAVGLGGLLVREREWSLVRALVLRRAEGDDFQDPRYSYNNWIRHAVTMGARTGLLAREGNVSLLSLALERVREEECLRPDLPAEDDRLLDSLCQFDFLACVVAMDDAGSTESRVFYPNFSRYYERRTSPAVQRLLSDEDMRRAIFRRGDDELAIVLDELGKRAASEGFSFAGWHDFPPSVEEWIRNHRPPPKQSS